MEKLHQEKKSTKRSKSNQSRSRAPTCLEKEQSTKGLNTVKTRAKTQAEDEDKENKKRENGTEQEYKRILAAETVGKVKKMKTLVKGMIKRNSLMA